MSQLSLKLWLAFYDRKRNSGSGTEKATTGPVQNSSLFWIWISSLTTFDKYYKATAKL